jgi:hypothetical protein
MRSREEIESKTRDYYVDGNKHGLLRLIVETNLDIRDLLQDKQKNDE